jgi:hypothetical protein
MKYGTKITMIIGESWRFWIKELEAGESSDGYKSTKYMALHHEELQIYLLLIEKLPEYLPRTERGPFSQETRKGGKPSISRDTTRTGKTRPTIR